MTAHDALRKAAILIDSIDARTADALLEQMGPQQAAKVRSAVLDLPEIPAAERERVIAEFLGRAPAAALRSDDQGVELDASLTSKFGLPDDPPGSSASAHPADLAAADSTPRPFDFLHRATPDSLAALLAREHSQTAALVLAHLTPAHAAKVIKTFPPQAQADVIRRMIDLEETAPEILAEVERQIEALLSHELRASRRRRAGMATVGAILAAAGGSGREAILSNLADVDDRLAQRLDEVTEETAVVPAGNRWRKQLQQTAPEDASDRLDRALKFERPHRHVRAASNSVASAPAAATDQTPDNAPPAVAQQSPAPAREFDDLLELDDRALAAVLSAAQAELAILALTGAPQRLLDRVLKRLPRREAKALRKRIGETGPLRLRDIERAQAQLARVASRLAADGQIRIPKARRFAAAV